MASKKAHKAESPALPVRSFQHIEENANENEMKNAPTAIPTQLQVY